MTDTDFLEAVLREAEGQWVSQTMILQRSADRRGCGLTVHSRASDLRKRGLNIECKVERGWNERTQRHDGRATSFYRLTSTGADEPRTSSSSSSLAGENDGSPQSTDLGTRATVGASSAPEVAAADVCHSPQSAAAQPSLFDMPKKAAWA